MHYQINVTQGGGGLRQDAPALPSGNPLEITDLLRQLLEVQRDQANLLRSLVAAQDHSNRWKAFLNRWRQELPDLGDNCRLAVPVLESAFANSIHEISTKLATKEEDLEEEFALQEFLDRYGNRITQLGTLMNLLSPLAEASPLPKEPPQTAP